MLASPARRTLEVMSLAARPIWLRSEVKAPAAAGWPIIPSRMYVSRVMPTRGGGGAIEVGLVGSDDIGPSLGPIVPTSLGRYKRGLGPAPRRAISSDKPRRLPAEPTEQRSEASHGRDRPR